MSEDAAAVAVERLQFRCRACSAAMGYASEVVDPTGMAKGVVIEVYACTGKDCGRKSVVVHEPVGGLTAEAKTWIEKEVMRTGAFFPQDYLGRADFGNRSRYGR